jgi:hypothetical protein
VAVAVLLNGEDTKGGFSLFTLLSRGSENRLEHGLDLWADRRPWPSRVAEAYWANHGEGGRPGG